MQLAHPEACIVYAFRGMKTSLQVLAVSSSKHNADASEHREAEAHVALLAELTTQEQQSNQMVMPGYMQDAVVHGVKLLDGTGMPVSLQRTGDLQQPKRVRGVLVQLHKFYLRWPQLCRVCSCNLACNCKTYSDLWSDYAVSRGHRNVDTLNEAEAEQLLRGDQRAQIPSWWAWAKQQSLTDLEVNTCKGPERMVKFFESCHQRC